MDYNLLICLVEACYLVPGWKYLSLLWKERQGIQRNARRGRSGNIQYICSVAIGLWPFLLALLLIFYAGVFSYIQIMICLTLTGFIYYGFGWHILYKYAINSHDTSFLSMERMQNSLGFHVVGISNALFGIAALFSFPDSNFIHKQWYLLVVLAVWLLFIFLSSLVVTQTKKYIECEISKEVQKMQ